MMDWSAESALRWNCKFRGCHNVIGRPKLLALKDALPNKIAFTDIDGAVEYRGRFLILEWKGQGADIGYAQRLFHERLTALSDKICSIVVEGDPQSMRCDRLKVIYRGRVGEWEKTSLQDLKQRIWNWAMSPVREVA